MTVCGRCGAESHATAQFCADCGEALAPARASTLPMRAPLAAPVPFHAAMGMSVPAFLRCPHCGVPARPLPYFSRGFNVAKAAVLMIPMNFVGPLVFFLLRRDRQICGACRALLSNEAAFALAQASQPGGALVAYTADAGGALALEGEAEVAMVEHRAQRLKRRAWTWGGIATSLVGFGLVAAFRRHGHVQDIGGFLVAATPPGLVAAIAAFRSRAAGILARAKRARQRRLQVLDLARRRGGRLNVSYVAATLRLELSDAEALLGSMVDGHRVDMDVDDNGRITYVFTELRTG